MPNVRSYGHRFDLSHCTTKPFDGVTDVHSDMQAFVDNIGPAEFWLSEGRPALSVPLVIPAGSTLSGHNYQRSEFVGLDASVDVLQPLGDLELRSVGTSGGRRGINAEGFGASISLTRFRGRGAAKHGAAFGDQIELTVTDSRFDDNALFGLSIFGGVGSVQGSRAQGNASGFVCSGESTVEYSSCISSGNSSHGFLAAQDENGFSWSGCHAYGNDGIGFVVGRTANVPETPRHWTITGCRSHDNEMGFSIDPTLISDATVAVPVWGAMSACTAWENDIHGFFFNKAASYSASSLSSHNNGASGFLISDNLSAAFSTLTAHDNAGVGISLASGGAVPIIGDISIAGYQVSGNGIDFNDDGNHPNVTVYP